MLAIKDATPFIGNAPATLGSAEHVLKATAIVARDKLAAAAGDIDRGMYPRDVMRELGAAGALGAHLRRNGARFDLAIAAMEEVGVTCGSTAFMVWCHDVCGLYLEESGNPALDGEMLDAHAAGRSFGGTALSNPMKAFAGIEPMVLRAQRVAGGYEVCGTLPWVSHIGRGQYCGAIAGVVGDGGMSTGEIMFILDCDAPGVELRPCPHFSGMEGTSTWGLRLERLHVGEDHIVADPAQAFVGRIRAAFILLQCGMGLGVVRAGLDAMAAVEASLGHVNQFLHDRPDQIAAEFAELRARIMRLAQTPFEDAKDFLIDVLDTRAETGELALRAAQSALLHQGARGYLMSARPQRLGARVALRGHRDARHQAPALGDGPAFARHLPGRAPVSAVVEPTDSLGPWMQYLCRACGLVYDEKKGDPDGGLPPGTRFGDIPDDWECPICGVTKTDFEPYVPRARSATTPVAPVVPSRAPGIVVVGGGTAGWSVAEAIRRLDERVPITLITTCRGDVYNKPEISVALSRGLSPDRMRRDLGASRAGALGVRLVPMTGAVGLSVAARRLRTTRGPLSYTSLVLALGARPALPACLPPELCWRINDLEAWAGLHGHLVEGSKRVAVVGAGMVGCEVAEDLARAGHRVTLVERAPLPLSALLPSRASERLLAGLTHVGVEVLCDSGVHAVRQTADGAKRVDFLDGSAIEVDLVLAATGLATDRRLVAAAGLAFDNGIAVDPATLRTSAPNIYALGDCASIGGTACRFIEPIARQADVIAHAVLGRDHFGYSHEPPTIRLKNRSTPIVLKGAPGPGEWRVIEDNPERLVMEQWRDGELAVRLAA